MTAPRHGLAAGDGALDDAAQRQASQVGRGVQVGDVGLQRSTLGVGGGRNGLGDQGEQRLQVLRVRHAAVGGPGHRGASGLRRAVDDGEVQGVDLVLVDQVHEQGVDLVDDFADTRIGTVDLVDHDDDRQLLCQRLAQHEAGLRQRAFGGVHQQQHAVDHLQTALHLATEVGVAGGIDDVDGELLAVSHGVIHGSVLGQDGDALFALQVHGVHDAGVHVLVLPEGTGLPQHGVNQGGLAVVDVGDDRDIT